MKMKLLRQNNGSALISAAVAASVLAILVAGFVSYLSNEYMLNYHTHAWTQSVHLAEAGVEKGFAEFNYQYTLGGSTNGFTSSRGWTGSNGTYTAKLTLTNSLSQVVGTATTTVYGVGSINPSIQGVGVALVKRGPATISRAVKVGLSTSSMFPVGLMSKNTINLNGNNMYSDSFDSTDPTKSTSGRYDSTKKQANGDVASDDTIVNSINVGNADIYGKVYTGPNGTVSIGANGSVGNTFVNANRATDFATGTTDGYIRSDFSVDISSVSLPSGAASWSTTYGSINNNTTINGGDWKVTSISLNGSKTLTIQGNVRLYITGSTSIAGNGMIAIASNASLTVYSDGSLDIAGNGVVNNTGYAVKNQWFGTSSATSVNIHGNGDWIGTVYAPQADMAVAGNGSLYGAAVANSMTLGGNANFHYDESLKTLGGSSSYVVSSWKELSYTGGTWQ
jgi:hypothetical protein